jgi:hypothetical protein
MNAFTGNSIIYDILCAVKDFNNLSKTTINVSRILGGIVSDK